MEERIPLAALIALALVYLSAPPAQCADSAGAQTPVTWFSPTPLTEATTVLVLDASQAQPGQLEIADVLSYSGGLIEITPPQGWTLIRDNSSLSTRQALYWHIVQVNEDRSPTWLFNEPVNAQGAILLVEDVNATDPIDVSSGNVVAGPATATSVTTTTDGDFILAFFATDFETAGLSPKMPADLNVIVDPDQPSHEYWILGAYQNSKGATEDAACCCPQYFNYAAAQVALRMSSTTDAR